MLQISTEQFIKMNQKPIPVEVMKRLPAGYEPFWGHDSYAGEASLYWSEDEGRWSAGLNQPAGWDPITIYARRIKGLGAITDEEAEAYQYKHLDLGIPIQPKGADTADEKPLFPEDDTERQQYPIGEFCTCFFPRALAELSKFSVKNQQKHNPEGPLGWAKDKSIWSVNRIFRHSMEAWFAWRRGDQERCREELLSLAWRGLEGLERFLNNMEPFKK